MGSGNFIVPTLLSFEIDKDELRERVMEHLEFQEVTHGHSQHATLCKLFQVSNEISSLLAEFIVDASVNIEQEERVDEKLLSVREAGELLSMSQKQVRTRIHSGEFDSTQLGERMTRVYYSSILDYMERNGIQRE